MRVVVIMLAILLVGQSVVLGEAPSIDELIAEAQNGDSKAQKDVGVVLEIRGHLEKAAHMYKVASMANNARGQLLLANAYQHGRGVPQSSTIAMAWYIVASAMCDADGVSDEINNGPIPTEESEMETATDLAIMLGWFANRYGEARLQRVR